VNSLRLLIYDIATNLKKGRSHVMGELIPSSFISLIYRIEKRRTEMQEKHQLPIIRKEEFDAMVKENSLHCRRDIQELMDVRDATVFLRERGILFFCLREVYWTAQTSPPPSPNNFHDAELFIVSCSAGYAIIPCKVEMYFSFFT
jgi:hypothetical protein